MVPPKMTFLLAAAPTQDSHALAHVSQCKMMPYVECNISQTPTGT